MSEKQIGFSREQVEQLLISPEEDLATINSYNLSYSVHSLYDLITRAEINLHPEFQRNFVWDLQRASYFIDSLLIGIPTPSLFLGRNKYREDFVVIDGLQRLKTIYFYINGTFGDEGHEKVFKLKNLQGRPWDKHAYKDLPIRFQRRLDNAVLNVTVIEDVNLRPEVVHDVFYRINTGGVPLTNQEVRNCVYPGPLNNGLMELNLDSNWRVLLGEQLPDKRLADVELILRFLALYYGIDYYSAPMREFLTKFYAGNASHFLPEYSQLFVSTVTMILEQIGRDAFKYRRQLNRALCESLMVAVAKIITNGYSTNRIGNNYNRLLNYEDYISSITGTSIFSTQKVNQRIWHAFEVLKG